MLGKTVTHSIRCNHCLQSDNLISNIQLLHEPCILLYILNPPFRLANPTPRRIGGLPYPSIR